ncbi:MAG: beta-galactosidase [Angelakisella sp.]
MNQLSYSPDEFLLNGKPFRMLSGAIHYFRTLPECWEDRLKKLKACGLNTVETYCCWNLHELQEGQFDFTGLLDLGRFLDMANSLGLYAIVRPGPFICAEWDFGGLPYWLHNTPLHLRCSDPAFLAKLRPYLDKICEIVRPRLGSTGGNVLMLQVENEYGSYGDDKDYLQAIADIYLENGIDCMLFTSDGTSDAALSGGTLPQYLSTCNFGSRGREANDKHRQHFPDQPLLCTEFWNGWFDHWGEPRHVRSGAEVADAMNEVLELGGSLNLYMFHGGTNFNFWNGANHHDRYYPTITSYDYDAPLSEAGDMTEKYYAVKAALEQRFGAAPKLAVANSPKAAYGSIALTKKAGLLQNLAALAMPVNSAFPMTFEQLLLPFGFVLYSTVLVGNGGEQTLTLCDLHDRAQIFLDGKPAGIEYCAAPGEAPIKVEAAFGQEVRLDILVENMGRVNFGHRLGERKGLVGGVLFGGIYHSGWTQYPLGMTDLSKLHYGVAKAGQPVFMTGSVTVDAPMDTFVRLDGFTKGVVFVNGFNLGRFWNTAGPQKTLYLPAPLLHAGTNDLTVLELEPTGADVIQLVDTPDLG